MADGRGPKVAVPAEDLQFEVELSWTGSGRDGAGRISTDDLELDYSVPASMGGRNVGTNPEELLVCAVATCYAATLFGVLQRARLAVADVRVGAIGTVTGYPSAARFDRLTVSPTIVGGDDDRRPEYEHAAQLAHDRCFIGRTLAGTVEYRVGTVTIERATERTGG
ncbi:MAG: OsmC family protein [Gaiellales bacterium]